MYALIMILTLFSPHGFTATSTQEKLAQLDPYSLDSIEEHFPETIKHVKIIDKTRKGGNVDYINQRSVDLHLMVPQILSLLKEQQQEIKRLNERLHAPRTKQFKKSSKDIH